MISEIKKDKSAALEENGLSPLPYFDWDKAKYFYYVARLKSFSQAGQFFKISQSGLSRKVQTLESHLGFKVFNRNQKGVELTRKGEQLFNIIETTFLNLKRLNFDPIVKTDDGQQRIIRIAATHADAAYILNDLILSYNEQHPYLIFELISDDQMIDIVLNDVDIAIRPFDSNAQGVHQEYLFSLEKKLFASSEYIKKYGEPKTIEDLTNHQIIAPAQIENYPYAELNWIVALGMSKGQPKRPIYKSNSIECLIQAAKKGKGIIASYEKMTIVRDSGLINVLPQITHKEADGYFIYPKYSENDRDIMNLKNFLLQNI